MIQSYNLNLVPNTLMNVVVKCSQYDKNSRTVQFNVFNGNALYTIPDGCTVTVRGTKPQDMTGFEYACEYSGSTITFDIEDQMTIYPGKIPAEIRITKNGTILNSANFVFNVEASALSDDTVISETELPLLEEAVEAAVSALESAQDAEAYATGKRGGEDVSSDDPAYHNNAKYYSDEASDSATSASGSASDASGYASDALGYKNEAKGFRDDASGSASSASADALKSEGYALGKQNGVDVTSGSPYYHANAKYFSDDASNSATTATNKAGEADTSATNASTSALKSEGFAVGQQNGVDVASDSPYYENNAKYYADEAGNIKDEMQVLLDNVAMQDGYYEDMTVGNSLQLVSNVYETDKDPYTFRTSGGSLEIGDRESDKLVGCSYAWNQLIQDGNFTDVTKWAKNGNVSIAVSGNILTATVTGALDGNEFIEDASRVIIPTGHKGLYSIYVKPSRTTYCRVSYSSVAYNTREIKCEADIWTNVKGVISSINNARCMIYFDLGQRLQLGDTVQFKLYNHSDITITFSSNIADYIYNLDFSHNGDGVAFFKKYFPKDYYPYCAESLLSVNASSHKMTGFNQWDEEWEVEGSYIVSKNYIPVLPNTTYHGTSPTGTGPSNGLLYYDADKNLINTVYSWGSNNNFTTPENCWYIKFKMANAYGTTYNNDICINLHWDGERDGEYEPYDLHSYPLDSVTLRGIPKLDASNNLYCDGDTYESDGTVTRKYGIVDMGTLEWTMESSYDIPRFYATVDNLYVPSTGTQAERYGSGLVCERFVTSENPITFHDVDKTIARYNGKAYVLCSGYNSRASFKTAMDGVYLVYELATPTTESADPFQDPQVVDNWGTEEYVVTAQNGVDIPVGHETKYPVDLKAKIEVAPDSPDSDGDYLMHRENGENSYVAFVKEIPTLPSEDGNYLLKCTVSGSTKILSWESQT